jgi:hypothetical protein
MTRIPISSTLLMTVVVGQQATGQPVPDKTVRDATHDVLTIWSKDPPKIPKLGPKGTKDCKAFLAFKPDLVRKDLVAKRDLLTKSLTRKEQQALKAYIIDEFPLQLAGTTSECVQGSVVVPDEILAARRRADDFIAGLSRASYAIVLDITSAPNGAKFSFSPKYANDWTEVGTDVTGQKTWRGKYKYKVEKAGYLTVSGERTLMDGDRIRVTCSLTKEPPAPTAGSDTGLVTVVVPCNFNRE